jgi:hypothetical protein
MVLALVQPALPDIETQAALMADLATPLFPATLTILWLGMTAVNGVLAQGALASFGVNRRPAPDIARLTLPRWFALLPVGAALLAWLGPGDWGYLGGNLVPVLAIAYVLAGLAVAHAAVRGFGGRLFLLIPVYATLPLAGVPLAACGMIDQWFALRPRVAAAPPRQGEE